MAKETFDPRWKEKSLMRDPLARAAEEAKKLGMTYGQYQSMMNSKRISERREPDRLGVPC